MIRIENEKEAKYLGNYYYNYIKLIMQIQGFNNSEKIILCK